MFPSSAILTDVSDYGYIKYLDNGGGSTENGRLVIGIENDTGSDSIVLMTPSSTGYVGINTTTPTCALDISGNIKSNGNVSAPSINGNLTGNVTASTVSGSTSVSGASIYGNLTGNVTAKSVTITDPGSGITPGYNGGSLTIKHETPGGTSSIVFPSSAILTDVSDYGYIKYLDNGGGSTENGRLVIGIENDTGSDSIVLMTPSSTGYVGINKINPTCALDVNGNIKSSASICINNGMAYSSYTSVGTYFESFIPCWSDNNTYLTFGPSGFNIRNVSLSCKIFIKDTGEVGIGTQTPTCALDVNGNIKSNGNISAPSIYGNLTGSVNARSFIITDPGSGITPSKNGGGSLTIKHETPGGTSSIVFPSSGTNDGGDYGYIKYLDNEGGSTENGRLVIGIENDTGSDSIVLMTPSSTGYVGINKMNPTCALDVSGNIISSGRIEASNFNATSDIRIKTNISKIIDTNIEYFNPVYYFNESTKQTDYGFIAQEIENIFPELVHTNNCEPYYKSVNYNGIIPILTKEIQYLKQQIKDMQLAINAIQLQMYV